VTILTVNRTLIAYVTKGGATKEYALEIASILRDKYGLDLDIIDLRKNKSPDLSKYRNVIVGTGVRMFRVYKEGVKFIEKNNFDGKRVALFLSSGKAGDPKTYGEAIEDYINKQILKKNPRIKPVAAEAFGGRMRILGKDLAPPGYADQVTTKVRAWAEELGKQLME
jgi:menaquinone-dependent protoporphyrinogen IX oxidase